MLLAGDIGGTKTLLALFKRKSSKFILLKEQKYTSADWSSLEDVISEFLSWAGVNTAQITSGCISLAGPIQGHSCRLVNLNKTLDLAKIQSFFKFCSPLTFCNDLVATGHGIFTLESSDLYCLNPEIQKEHEQSLSNRAVIAPGTGLGESVIVGENHVYPTEGAHVDFAPRSELEVRLWRFLAKQFGHVSYERILSGPGLVNIYRFLQTEMPDFPHTSIPSPAEISEKALASSCPLSIKALDLFVQILGAEAGNLALKSLALGGIFLGGGIPPKILPKLKDGTFLNSFQDKGRFRELVKNIPVYVILNNRTALYGAARISSFKCNIGL